MTDEYTRGLVDGLRRASDQLFEMSRRLMRNADAADEATHTLLALHAAETVSDPGTVGLKVLHTDGSCSVQTRIGGWAWVDLEGDRFDSGSAAPTTNNAMEIQAAYQAVYHNAGDLKIVSDSRYVVDSFQSGWLERWEKSGWLTSTKSPVKNQDLWEPFWEHVKHRRAKGATIVFEWVRGHNGDPGNERADQLAGQAAKRHLEMVSPVEE